MQRLEPDSPAQGNAVTTGTPVNLPWHAQKTLNSRDGEYLRVRFLVKTRRKASSSAIYLKLSEGAFTLVPFMACISQHSTTLVIRMLTEFSELNI